ncbi:MAG: PAS domain-containing protein, partial [Myxococcales bacterium]
MSVLADFLAADRDAIVQLFTGRASSPELAAQLPATLTALEDALRRGDPARAAAGSPRTTGDLAARLRAYRELRACLHERMEAADLRPSLRELRWLAEALSASRDGAPPDDAPGEDSRPTGPGASEAALAASQESYRTLFETIDDGFCLIEMLFDDRGQPVDYRFVEANAAFERHTGLRGAVGQRMRDLVPAHDQHWFDIYGRVALTGESIRFENAAVALQRWFDVSASRFGPPEQRRVAVVFKDISDRKKVELEREKLLHALARSNQELDQFASIASHDLKAPLRGIASLSHWIEDDLGDDVSDEIRQNLV